MAVILAIIISVVAVALFYYHGPHSRFRRYGVKYLTPVPLLGDMGRVILRIQHVLDNMDRLYKAFPGERFIGITELVKPVIVIRDPELVRRVTVQDFDYFQDHGLTVDKDVDQVFGRNLFSLKGQDWKNMRSNVSPLFTSSRLRVMFPVLIDAGNNIITRVQAGMKESGENYMDLDMYDVTTRFANDVFASIVYGIRLDSQNHHKSDFFTMAKSVTKLKYAEILKFLGYQHTPNVMKILNATMFSKKSSEFFRELLDQTLRNCKTLDTHRPEMIDTFLRSKSEWTDNDLLAQIIGLLVAGFDATASAMAFLIHMLALHPHVQEKLKREIEEYGAKNGGKWDYDCIREMPYLDMVVAELLRKWATSVAERVCVKDYNLGRPNNKATKDYIIRKGETVRIFLRSIHHDPDHFPDPHKFDPGRFSKENRANIRPGTYNPFGAGPRICVGSRFAIFEMKVLIVHLLQHMEILPCEKTTRDIQLSILSITPLASGGHWVRLRPRNEPLKITSFRSFFTS